MDIIKRIDLGLERLRVRLFVPQRTTGFKVLGDDFYRTENPAITRLLADASLADLHAVREAAWQEGLLKLARAAAQEIRARKTALDTANRDPASSV